MSETSEEPATDQDPTITAATDIQKATSSLIEKRSALATILKNYDTLTQQKRQAEADVANAQETLNAAIEAIRKLVTGN